MKGSKQGCRAGGAQVLLDHTVCTCIGGDTGVNPILSLPTHFDSLLTTKPPPTPNSMPPLLLVTLRPPRPPPSPMRRKCFRSESVISVDE